MWYCYVPPPPTHLFSPICRHGNGDWWAEGQSGWQRGQSNPSSSSSHGESVCQVLLCEFHTFECQPGQPLQKGAGRSWGTNGRY